MILRALTYALYLGIAVAQPAAVEQPLDTGETREQLIHQRQALIQVIEKQDALLEQFDSLANRLIKQIEHEKARTGYCT